MASMSRRAPRELGYRGRQVLSYIRLCIDTDGRAPSYDMIVREFDFATRGNVAHVVRRLETRGLLKRVGAGRCRRISLTA